MAGALDAFDDGFDDLMLCIICQEEYNNEDRIPKFLNCTHTFCLKCIKAWVKNKIIDCPICRDVTPVLSTVSEMKTNRYVLKHIEVRSRKTEIVGNFLWCFPCGKAAQLECNQSGHKLFMVENGQVHQRLKQLTEHINECKTNWNLLIQYRRQFQQSVLDNIYKSFKILQDQLNRLMEENQWHVARAESLLGIAEQSGWQQNQNIDILALMEAYANNVQESRKQLQDSEQFVAQFHSIRQLRCNLTTSTATDSNNKNGKRIIDFSFDENQPNITVATYAMAAILKTMLPSIEPNETAAVNPEENNTTKKIAGTKTRTKSVNGYAAALRHSPTETEQNEKQVTRPLSSGQVRCFMTFNVDGFPFGGRVTILLEVKAAPIMCKTFINACLGKNTKYKGTRIFQCKEDDFICGGDMEETGLSKMYIADRSTLKDDLGVIRMRRRDNKDKTVLVGTEFHIILSRGPYMTFHYTTVFGRVVDGLDTCEQVSKINPFVHDIRVEDCGVL